MNPAGFTFSDTIAGYVTSFDEAAGSFLLRTTDEREFCVHITDVTYAELLRNLDEPWQDPGGPMQKILTPGKYVYAYCTFYPEQSGTTFEAQRIILVGEAAERW